MSNQEAWIRKLRITKRETGVIRGRRRPSFSEVPRFV